VRRFGFKSGVGVLAALLGVALLLASPADARRHHHHHHHRGGGGGGVVCGPGTVLVNGVCTPVPNPGPQGNANVVISPSDVTMNLNGTFAASAVVSGLPPLANSNAVAPTTCGTGTFTIAPAAAVSDALGRRQVTIAKAATGCVPGTYPIVFTETVSPFQSFTGFITLHF
jgi:hypothetical protein